MSTVDSIGRAIIALLSYVQGGMAFVWNAVRDVIGDGPVTLIGQVLVIGLVVAGIACVVVEVREADHEREQREERAREADEQTRPLRLRS